MDDIQSDSFSQNKTNQKIKGISDFILILRDRWMISLTLALPIALGFAYKSLNVPEYFASSSSFRLIPPPAIINLQKVDREQQLQPLVAKHQDGLNSQELRAQVVTKIENNPELKTEILSPYIQDGLNISVSGAISYSVSVSGEGRPRFTISSNARSARAAMIIAREVQTEYEILHKSRANLKVESAKKTLEGLLEKELQKEVLIKKKMSELKNKNNAPFLEDIKKDNATRKSQYQSEITRCNIEQLRLESILSQVKILQINIENKRQKTSTIEERFELFSEYFKIDEIENYGDIPNLRISLFDLYKKRRDYQEIGTGYLENHPKMQSNARQIQDTYAKLNKQVQDAIFDMKNKQDQLTILANDFTLAMAEVQGEANSLSRIEDDLSTLERELQIVQSSTSQMQRRLNDVTIEQAFPQDQDDPLQKEQFASVPGGPYSPNKNDIHKKSLGIFLGIFFVIPFLLEFVDNRIKSPWDIEVFLGRELISGIPKISNILENERPLIVGNDLDDGLGESFRSMFSKIQMHSKSDYPKIILVTSAIPSEGKSLISANLAYTCANHGKKTTLIDFDLRRPGLHKIVNLDNDSGIIKIANKAISDPNYIKDNISRELKEIHPNLKMLSSGGKTRSVTELIEKKEFSNLISELKTISDVIVVDSPPIGLFPDALAFAKIADDVIFVTRYGKVARRVAKNLLNSIEETGTNILGVVLNDLPQKRSTGYYYSGYYGYGYYRYKYYNKYYGKTEDA